MAESTAEANISDFSTNRLSSLSFIVVSWVHSCRKFTLFGTGGVGSVVGGGLVLVLRNLEDSGRDFEWRLVKLIVLEAVRSRLRRISIVSEGNISFYEGSWSILLALI